VGLIVRAMLDRRRPLVTTSDVVVETVALLQRRIGLAPARDLAEHVLPLLSVEWVSETLHRKGLDRLFREDRHESSLVDCVSVEFTRSQRLREALALGEDFAAAGYRLLPTSGR
jgi:predicted nucleic acid-binding protein